MSAVTIVMGSKSDLASLQGAFDTLKQFGVPFSARILSAHRTPDEAADLAKNAVAEGKLEAEFAKEGENDILNELEELKRKAQSELEPMKKTPGE